MEYMAYRNDNHRIVVVYPQVGEAITAYRKEKNLPEIKVSELRYGLDEVMSLVNLLDAELLTGDEATIHGLIRILSQPTDILWILTHGLSDGWFLKDGLVSASETTAFVRSSGVFLTVMNSCSSYEVAQTVADELGTAFISTLTEVPDRQAFITGTLFARHLASGLDYVSAWDRSRPGQKHPYVLIEAKRGLTMNQRDRGAPPDNLDMSTLRRFIQSVSELEKIVYGDVRFGLLPMRELTNQLKVEIENLKNRELAVIQMQLAEVIKKQTERNHWLIGQGILIIILMVIVGIFILGPGGS